MEAEEAEAEEEEAEAEGDEAEEAEDKIPESLKRASARAIALAYEEAYAIHVAAVEALLTEFVVVQVTDATATTTADATATKTDVAE